MEDKEVYFRVPEVEHYPDIELNIIRVGKSRVHPNYRIFTTGKRHYTIKVITAGFGVLKSGSSEYRLTAGDVILYWRGHSYHWWTDPNKLLYHYWIDLEGRVAHDLFASVLPSPDQCILKAPNRDREIGLIERLLALFREAPPHFYWKSISVFFDLWHLIVSQIPTNNAGDYTYPERAKAFIDRYFCEEISMRDIADYVGVTPEYLSTVFHNAYGMAPYAYVIECRLRHACNLLRQGIPVREVAASVGYRDPNYFSRLFRRKYGAAPSSVRRSKD